MGICTLSGTDKKLVAGKVGRELVHRHGKRRYYSIPEVRDAARRQDIPEDWVCWAYALFTDSEHFYEYHGRIGQPCNYAEMLKAMLEVIRSCATTPRHVDGISEVAADDFMDMNPLPEVTIGYDLDVVADYDFDIN